MLAEWFKHLTLPCPAPIRDMGYARELIAIEARHRRCRDAWAPHLEHCHKVIGDAAEGISRDRVIVLGSGLLLDIPLAELSETFSDVVLVDIFHLPAARKKVHDMANVRLETIDITGLADATWTHVREGRTGPLPPPRADAGAFADADLVVSANVLTQLPLLPMGWVEEKGKGYEEDDIKAFARRIVDHHLDLLAALPGRVCLLTESLRVICDGDEVLQEIDPLFGATIPASGLKWTWDIAPRPEITRRIDLRFRMTGIADLKDALA
ncbi:MAG: hypothetical protein IIA35_05375 [Proteobacteria bacterium]|nr:hypothetical protein [Pseudomonadota bacterium]